MKNKTNKTMRTHNRTMHDDMIEDELAPLIETEISYYIDEELRYIETIEDLEDFENTNCPEELKTEIMEKISQEQASMFNEYELELDNLKNDDINAVIEDIIDSSYEDIKSEKSQIKREVFEREDFFGYEDDY